MKIAVVTGASSGLGEEFVRQISRDTTIDEIWMIARREELLQKISSSSPIATKIFPMDVTKEDNLEHFKQILEEKKPTICILVNCAGYGIRKAFIEGNYQEELGMIDINCRSLTAITYLCIPYMHKGSRILQIASAAAFLPQGGFAVYSASKAYVLSFSRALHKELRTKGIGVTAVCPGPVDTDFFSISDAGGSMPVWKKLFLAKTNRVVAKALEDSKRKKSVSMYGFAIHALRFITRFYS